MEDTLRALSNIQSAEVTRVLILVLMEDTLRALELLKKGKEVTVLILVLMEDTLRGQEYHNPWSDNTES